jgi:hypothetical protein
MDWINEEYLFDVYLEVLYSYDNVQILILILLKYLFELED